MEVTFRKTGCLDYLPTERTLINVHSGKGECRLVKVGLPGCSVTEEG